MKRIHLDTDIGGYVRAAGAGYPNWRADVDYNGQQNTLAAGLAYARCDPLMAQLSVALEVTLRDAAAVDGPRLEREWVEAVRSVGGAGS